MTWVKTQGVFTNKPWHKSWLVSESRSKSQYRSARWWLAPRLTFEYHNQTGICFTNTRNYCHRNKIYVFTSLLKQIYLQPAACARIYCTVNTACHSCCHHREFTSWRTHERQCCYCGFEMTSQLLPLTLNERTSHRPSNDAIWDLRHDLRRDLTESRWFSFVNTTWLGPGPSLKWDSDRVSRETRSGSKPSLESSLKSRLLVNTAPGRPKPARIYPLRRNGDVITIVYITKCLHRQGDSHVREEVITSSL